MIKRLILLLPIYLLLCYSTSHAQYQSLFGESTTRWVTEWGNLFGGFQDTIYIVKDTFFAGKNWKEIACTPTPWGDIPYPGGYLSEDTITGKVWYKSKPGDIGVDTSIQLAFDFSLQVGDTFDITNVRGNVPDSLWIIDSIYQENGRQIIQFKYQIVSGERFNFIAGIGCNLGIVYKQKTGIMQAHYLLCAYKDSTQTYLNKYYGTCDVIPDDASSTSSIQENASIRMYPNPVRRSLYIETDDPSNITTVQIYNNLGQKVLQAPFSNTLDLGSLPKGFYHLILSSSQTILFSQSINKQ